jgi:hypothetical protein
MKIARSSRSLGFKNDRNWLAGPLSGQKNPISRYTSQFFLTLALLGPAKNRFVWRKRSFFGSYATC